MSFYSQIKDTCSCGAVLDVAGDHADITHSKWLIQHQVCRQQYRVSDLLVSSPNTKSKVNVKAQSKPLMKGK